MGSESIIILDSELVPLVKYGERIALESIARRGYYVSARVDLPWPFLKAEVTHVKGWEEFTMCRVPFDNRSQRRLYVRYGSLIAFQAFNRKFVTYNRDGDKLLASAVEHVSDWETFAFIRHYQGR